MKLRDINPQSTIDTFFANFRKFIASKTRNVYVNSDDGLVSVYVRKGFHFINDDLKVQNTLDIANISIEDAIQGKGIGAAIVNGIHAANPFGITYVESILNKTFYANLKKNGWSDVPNSEPPSVYKVK